MALVSVWKMERRQSLVEELRTDGGLRNGSISTKDMTAEAARRQARSTER